jgi:hypothetical protein
MANARSGLGCILLASISALASGVVRVSRMAAGAEAGTWYDGHPEFKTLPFPAAVDWASKTALRLEHDGVPIHFGGGARLTDFVFAPFATLASLESAKVL